MPYKPETYEIDTVRYVIGQAESIEEILNGIDVGHFGPDFLKAKESVYTLRRYLEIELTQYDEQES